MTGWEVALVVLAWVAFGAAATVVMRRRGHDPFAWGITFLFLGPLAFVVLPRRHHSAPVVSATARPGELDILVADDGSEHARNALELGLGLLGTNATSVTIATVVDVETATTLRGTETELTAETRLRTSCTRAGALTGAPVDTVILYGRPAAELEQFALDHGYELIVAGSRGRGATRALVGSVAQQLAAQGKVPVLIGGRVRP